MFKFLKNNMGFTLIELIVVISIISLLSTIVLSTVHLSFEKASDSKRVADFKQLQLALELFKNDYGRYPKASEVDNDAYYFDYSSKGNFLKILVDKGYLSSKIVDSVNSGGSAWSSGSRLYAYGATPSGKYYMLMTQFETPNNPLSAQYRCNESRWTGGWRWNGSIIYKGCCPPYGGCTSHTGTKDSYVISSPYP